MNSKLVVFLTFCLFKISFHFLLISVFLLESQPLVLILVLWRSFFLWILQRFFLWTLICIRSAQMSFSSSAFLCIYYNWGHWASSSQSIHSHHVGNFLNHSLFLHCFCSWIFFPCKSQIICKTLHCPMSSVLWSIFFPFTVLFAFHFSLLVFTFTIPNFFSHSNGFSDDTLFSCRFSVWFIFTDFQATLEILHIFHHSLKTFFMPILIIFKFFSTNPKIYIICYFAFNSPLHCSSLLAY